MCKLSPPPPKSQEVVGKKFSISRGNVAYTFDKRPFLVQACSRCISPPPTRLVAFPATSVAVWPVRVCARVVDNISLLISILFAAKAPHTLNSRPVGFRFALPNQSSQSQGKTFMASSSTIDQSEQQAYSAPLLIHLQRLEPDSITLLRA